MIADKTIRGIVTAQSDQVDHVLAKDEIGRIYVVTKKFSGHWSALRRGDVLELIVTCEPMPKVLSSRLLAARGTEAMATSGFASPVCKVLGLNTEPPYALVECPEGNQYMVNRRNFSGDWAALSNGDNLELAVSVGVCARMLSAWLKEAHS